jgi:two-component system nitrogen regulation response regulator NtrX
MIRTILVVDDENSIRHTLKGALEDEGFKVDTAEDGKDCLQRLEAASPDLILLDIWMPGMDGIKTLEAIRKRNPNQLVIVMSGHGTVETAVRATKLGAYDFVEKPLSLERLIVTIENLKNVKSLSDENTELREKLGGKYEFIGGSAAIQNLREQLRRVAPTNSSVLITGENGSGKEVVANFIHSHSARSNHVFVAVNCAAIPEELIESELFGHEKGAFTGATSRKHGKFDKADGGTLFLDEIGDMSMRTQAKILRILQEQQFERVGGSSTVSVDVRIIAATNKDLESAIENGEFREDLYYRLNVIPFHVPSLRDRREDIPLLAENFLDRYSAEVGQVRKFTADAMKCLVAYDWPGNVRELKNLVERLVIMAPSEAIGQNDLPEALRSAAVPGKGNLFQGDSIKEAKKDFEREFIIRKLQQFGGNISKTAEAIGMERSSLHRKIKDYNIDNQ